MTRFCPLENSSSMKFSIESIQRQTNPDEIQFQETVRLETAGFKSPKMTVLLFFRRNNFSCPILRRLRLLYKYTCY